MMGKTAWRAAPYYGRPRWLMTDGTVLQAPMIETTPSQRRWRIAGTELSVQKHDLSGEIDKYMRNLASSSGKAAWLELDEDDDLDFHRSKLGSGYNEFDITEVPTIDLSSRSTTAVAFEFVSSQYPDLRALLWVSMAISSSNVATITSMITHRSTDPALGHDHSIQATIEPTPPEINWHLAVERFGSNARKAAGRFAELLRWATEVDTISLPDGRPDRRRRGDRLEYEFTRTNYSPDLYRQLLDVVQSGPAMERLWQHMLGVKKELANLGIVANEKDGFDLQDLLNGKLSELQVAIVPQEEEDGSNQGLDQQHKVHLDLVRGIFVVSCTRHHLEEVAEQWNVAKFKAELTGETDILMAYAEAHNAPAEKARLRKVIKERQIKPMRT